MFALIGSLLKSRDVEIGSRLSVSLLFLATRGFNRVFLTFVYYFFLLAILALFFCCCCCFLGTGIRLSLVDFSRYFLVYFTVLTVMIRLLFFRRTFPQFCIYYQHSLFNLILTISIGCIFSVMTFECTFLFSCWPDLVFSLFHAVFLLVFQCVA